MAKIAFIGAGSTVFAKNLLGDILAYGELADSRIVLHDIDEERLGTTKRACAVLFPSRGETAPTQEALACTESARRK